MWRFLRKNPVERLEAQYLAKMKLARDTQRSGDVVAAARIVGEAEAIRARIEAFEAGADGPTPTRG